MFKVIYQYFALISVTGGATIVRKTMSSSSGTGQVPHHSETMTVTQTGADGQTVTYTSSSEDGESACKICTSASLSAKTVLHRGR